MVDRAVVLYRPHWEWVVREVPPNQVDPYRVEGILRVTPPGRGNVPIMGDSTALASLDPRALGRDFADRGLRFLPITIGGAPAINFGMLASGVLALDPGAAILFVSPSSTRSKLAYDRIHVYDVRAVPALFGAGEVLRHWQFHLGGIASQANVLLRHRQVMRTAAAVRLGWTSWGRVQLDVVRARLRGIRRGEMGPLVEWLRDVEPDRYPNANTRAVVYLARRLAARDATLVLVESPVHPLTRLITPAAKVQAFRDYMAALARAEGATFIAAPELPTLDADDFEDQSHLNERGRQVMTEALGARLRAIL
jgi:hypothetical protein